MAAASSHSILMVSKGLGVLHEWIRQHGPEWTETRSVRTKRGGHLYFRWPAGETRIIRNSAGKIALGVDVRGEAGYVIIPPSIHPEGTHYEWAGDPHIPIAEAPGWLLEMVLSASSRGASSPNTHGNGDVGTIPQGQRNATLASFAGTLRHRSMSPAAIEAALLAENAARCNPPLPECEVRTIAASVSRYAPATDPEPPAPKILPSWPEPLTPEAFQGLAGEYVRTVESASEADPAALLLQFLVAAGNAIGHRPYYVAEDTPHYLNLYVVAVGLTSKSRKGTSWNRVRKSFAEIDGGEWTSRCIASGLSSGEGLIEAVRDASGEDDAGIADKRLLISQGEFCGVLRAMEREGNTLSIVLRDAWDGVILRTMTRKNNALRSTDSHVSLIGHITRDELRSVLTETDKANGFANRILWACIARSKELADEVEIDGAAWATLTSDLKSAVGFASKVNRLRRTDEAQAIWRKVYHDLSEGKMGMFGAVTSRAEAQVVRLSCLYALLDWSEMVRPEHLKAALAVWRYCEDSARYIFGDALGDAVADAILAALKENTPGGLSRNEIRELFARNKSSTRIQIALDLLRELGKVTCKKEQTDGRPVEVWSYVGTR
jgi:hypothetical protein